jgi:DNA-directed RNA polymerase subunit RPC12/RpoP
MRQYKIEKTQKLEKIICNKCGKEILFQGEVAQGDVLSVEKRWGYFSDRDNEVHRFDLCESCYNELIATFQIPIEIE